MPLQPIELLKPLAQPWLPLDLAVDQSVVVHITGYEEGTLEIEPHDARPKHSVHAVRLFLQARDLVAPPLWRDITAKKLQAQLLPFLRSGTYEGRSCTIRKLNGRPIGDCAVTWGPVTP